MRNKKEERLNLISMYKCQIFADFIDIAMESFTGSIECNGGWKSHGISSDIMEIRRCTLFNQWKSMDCWFLEIIENILFRTDFIRPKLTDFIIGCMSSNFTILQRCSNILGKERKQSIIEFGMQEFLLLVFLIHVIGPYASAISYWLNRSHSLEHVHLYHNAMRMRKSLV